MPPSLFSAVWRSKFPQLRHHAYQRIRPPESLSTVRYPRRLSENKAEDAIMELLRAMREDLGVPAPTFGAREANPP